jgi:site-specific recombinase XerD
MSAIPSQRGVLLEKFKEHVTQARYSSNTVQAHVAAASLFLDYLSKQKVPIEEVCAEHVTAFLDRELNQFSQRNGRPPASANDWWSHHLSAVRRFLRCVNGRLPVLAAPRSPFEVFSQVLCDEFVQWLDDRRGLSVVSIDGLVSEARRFLEWYGKRKTDDDLASMEISDIDAYVQARATALRRVSLRGVTHRLRCFLRFAHASGRTAQDFALSVDSPMLYALESIPSCLRDEEIRTVVEATSKDTSPKGLRDHAILQLLSSYGLRAGEITRLKLEDIDWRGDRIRVLHTKTAAHSILPLLPTVGEALLEYLRRGRPVTNAREVFIRTCAPYRGFASGSSLNTMIRERLDAAGVTPVGKRGPHAFRHARAVGLLRAGISQKVIGDVLGHRSAASTAPYLKLATEELRNVALEIPLCAEEDQP